MDVIPAIDLLAGNAVRLRQGRYDRVTVYSENPVALATEWKRQVDKLHLVDLEGAREGRTSQADTVGAIVDAFGPGVQVGGGIRDQDSVIKYFDVGVDRIVLGTAALHNRALLEWAQERYPGRIIVAVDARGGKVATDGWLAQSETEAVKLVQSIASLKISAVLYTDIERDGMEVGPNLEQTARLAEEGGCNVIASGGVKSLSDLSKLSRLHPRITATIVGRALHERRFSLSDALSATQAKNLSTGSG